MSLSRATIWGRVTVVSGVAVIKTIRTNFVNGEYKNHDHLSYAHYHHRCHSHQHHYGPSHHRHHYETRPNFVMALCWRMALVCAMQLSTVFAAVVSSVEGRGLAGSVANTMTCKFLFLICDVIFMNWSSRGAC